MAKRFSELPTMTTVTDGDYLLVNGGDTDTRKISFFNFASKFVRTDADTTISGNLDLSGLLMADGVLLRSPLLFVDPTTERIGIGTMTPEHKVDVHGNVQISNGGTARFANLTNEYAVTFQAPVMTESSTYALPAQTPVATGSVLAADPSGDMYWMATETSQVEGSQVMTYITSVPTSSSSTGRVGQVAVDNDYMYVCRAEDVWARIPLDSTVW